LRTTVSYVFPKNHREAPLFKGEEMNTRTVKELQAAVSRLSPQELARFREWFEEFEAKMWDEQFENDVKSGKLDHLAEQAIADLRAGNCKEL
jgi:hypothetical protein